MNDPASGSALASMRKSALLLAGAGSGLWGLALALMARGMRRAAAAAVVLAVLGAAVNLLAAGGALCMRRQRRLDQGLRDLFLVLNEPRSEAAVASGRAQQSRVIRRWLARRLFGHRWQVGDAVRVKSAAAIRATLDADAREGGLPFMQEMQAWCGRTLHVYRVLDKVYDYGRSRRMRRIDDAVLLVGARCDGSCHGGCEAACYTIWKSDWLEPAGAQASGATDGDAAAFDGGCQYIHLTGASREQRPVAWHGLVGPWVAGNVTTAAWGLALLTRAFNAFQAWRGGVSYPALPPTRGEAAEAGGPLRPGDWVRVRMPAEIARTLDKRSRHRGLWFDRDQLKFCGQVFQVRAPVRQIIDVGSGEMVRMKTPCITMHDVHYTGEFQGFGEQHDFLYYRECWLEPVAPPPPSAA